MATQTVAHLYALVLGFAMAGLLSSGYQAFAGRPLSFRLLGERPPAALAAVPLLTFGAPFVIMRNTIRGRQLESRRFEFAMLATVISCFWSLMCGTVVVQVLSSVAW
jgi:hypothetical protein